MNEQECKKWVEDARAILSRIYSPDEVEKLISWFKSIKGAGEHELLGHEGMTHLAAFMDDWAGWEILDCGQAVYHTMMARLFFYAPLILRHETR